MPTWAKPSDFPRADASVPTCLHNSFLSCILYGSSPKTVIPLTSHALTWGHVSGFFVLVVDVITDLPHFPTPSWPLLPPASGLHHTVVCVHWLCIYVLWLNLWLYFLLKWSLAVSPSECFLIAH